MQDIVELYKSFNRFKDNTDEELRLHILPSLILKQYQKHYEGNDLIGFTNWAFVSDKVKNKFIQTGMLEKEDWKSGYNLIFYDFVALKNVKKIFDWCIDKANKFIGLNKEFIWLRIDNNKIKRIVKRNR